MDLIEIIKKPWFNFVLVILFVYLIQNCFYPNENYNTGAIGPYSYSSGNYAYGTGDRYDKRLNQAYLHQVGW